MLNSVFKYTALFKYVMRVHEGGLGFMIGSSVVVQADVIMDLCPYADDLWLKSVSLITTTKTTAIYPFRGCPVTIYDTGESSLSYI